MGGVQSPSSAQGPYPVKGEEDADLINAGMGSSQDA